MLSKFSLSPSLSLSMSSFEMLKVVLVQCDLIYLTDLHVWWICWIIRVMMRNVVLSMEGVDVDYWEARRPFVSMKVFWRKRRGRESPFQVVEMTARSIAQAFW